MSFRLHILAAVAVTVTPGVALCRSWPRRHGEWTSHGARGSRFGFVPGLALFRAANYRPRATTALSYSSGLT
jgi:hypothetical protein